MKTQYRSLFWPLMLIGVGLVWLLANVGVLSLASISVLFRLWPLILIVIGIDLLFGRRSPALGGLIGLGSVALLVLLMLVGPSLGLSADVDVQEASYQEPAGDATSAQVSLEAAVGDVNVTPLADSNNLFEAAVRYIGDVDFEAEGGAERVVNLKQRGDVSLGLGFFGWLIDPDQQLIWDVRIDPSLPLELAVDTGTGGARLDLSDFDQLTRLDVDLGTGTADITLPRAEGSYPATINTGTGGGTVRIEEGAALLLELESGTGGFTIDVPDDAAVRLEGSTGTGGIVVPGSFRRLSEEDDSLVGDSGTWETEGFDDAERQIIITFSGGTGGLTVR